MNTTAHRLVPSTAALLLGLGPVAAADPAAADSGSADPWANEAPGTIVTVSEKFSGHLSGVAVRPDGTAHVAELNPRGLLSADRLVAVTPDGSATTVAGGPGAGYPFGRLRDIADVEAGRDGSLYVAIHQGPVVRVDPDGRSTVVASARPGPGHLLGAPPTALAAAPDGTIYIGAQGLVYELHVDGTLEPFGNGPFSVLDGLAADDTGDLYVTGNVASRVYRLDPYGGVHVFAGGGLNRWDPDEVGDGGPAAEADVPVPRDVAVDSDGSVYVSDAIGLRKVEADGTISTVVAEGEADPDQLAFDPHGNLYFTDRESIQLKVLVRPAEIPESAELAERAASSQIGAAAITVAGGGILAVLAVVLVMFWVRRRRAVGGLPSVRS